MKPLNLISIKPNLEFIGKRTIFFAFSVLLILASLSLFVARDLNYGIDFQGGILIEVRVDKAGKLGEMRQQLSNLGLGEISLQEFGAPTDILIRVQKQEGGEKAQQAAIGAPSLSGLRSVKNCSAMASWLLSSRCLVSLSIFGSVLSGNLAWALLLRLPMMCYRPLVSLP